jgi:hypothetical protein
MIEELGPYSILYPQDDRQVSTAMCNVEYYVVVVKRRFAIAIIFLAKRMSIDFLVFAYRRVTGDKYAEQTFVIFLHSMMEGTVTRSPCIPT